MPPGDGKQARRQMLLEMLAELDGGTSQPAILFSAAVDQYLADLATRSHSKWTAKMNRSMLRRIVEEIGDQPLRDVTVQKVYEWRAALVARGIANSTVNTRLATLASLFNVAKKFGQVEVAPTDEVPELPVEDCHRRRIARALSDWDASRLLAGAAELDLERGGVPQGLTLRALLLTGARWGELVQAKWSDVGGEGEVRTLRLRGITTKKGRTRVLPFDAGLLAEIERHRRGDTLLVGRSGLRHPRVGTQIIRFLRAAAERAGIPHVDASGEVLHIHALRHTFITRLVRAGVPLSHVQYLSGHADISVLTQTYTHLRVDDVRKAIECLPRLGVAGNVKKAQDGA